MAVRILLADDKEPIRKKIRAVLESHPGWEVVAEAASGLEAVQLAEQFQPDVAIIDYSMPQLDGISAIPKIRSVAPLSGIIVVTVHDARFTVRRAVNAGACGYVLKSEIVKDLVPAVEAASQHEPFISRFEN